MKYPLVEMYVDDEIKRRVLEILESGRYIKGPKVKHLKKNL